MSGNRAPKDLPMLPQKQDFVVSANDLDGRCAWENFGGLTLEEANKKFRENPLIYQEDFMFMGGKAFAFYFPVIESFLRETPAGLDSEETQAWILAKCIHAHFTDNVPSD